MHDAALIEASRNGDGSAFAQIVERYQRAVYAVSFAQLRDRSLSDDITQDTFVTAWRRLGELRDTTRLPAWLCGIARNHARDARKRQHREHGEDAGELVDPATPFDALSDAESEQLIDVALADVPDVYREALVLFYFEHHSVDEVARALGITPHTTNKRLSRGRQHLAARVEALLDSRLTRRGPRRDLAVCVLAAIAVLGSATYAEAAPAVTKGSTMLKLGLATTLVATVGGAGLLAARPTTHARTAPPSPPAATSTARPASRAPSPPTLVAATGGRAVPDCDAVARHMAELQVDALDRGHHFSPAKRDQFVALRSPELARHCTSEHWSDERRSCVMGADDSDSARVDCVEGIVATSSELVDLPRELRCDLVAKHQVELVTAPDGTLAAFVKKPGAHLDLDRLEAELDTQVTAECERIPWSLAVRRCILASKTQRELGHCM